MQKNKEKEFDAFVQKRMKKEGLEKPSFDFTTTLLNRIEMQSVQNRGLAYQPLISKSAWYIMAAITLSVLAFLVFGNLNLETGWLPQITLQKLGEIDLIGKLPKIAISDTYVYAFSGLAFFMGIQIYLVKKHFDNRYNLD